MKTGPRGGIDRRQSTTPRLPRPGSRADALERKVQSGALRGASVESGALRAASGDRSRGGDDPEAADGPGVRHGWPPSAVWRPSGFGSPLLHRPRPGEAHPPYAPNQEGSCSTKGRRGRVCGGEFAAWRLLSPRYVRSPALFHSSPTQTSRTGQAGQRIRRDKEMLGSAQRRQQFLRPGNPTVISVAYSGHLKTFT